jgi:hypothetical protein
MATRGLGLGKPSTRSNVKTIGFKGLVKISLHRQRETNTWRALVQRRLTERSTIIADDLRLPGPCHSQ